MNQPVVPGQGSRTLELVSWWLAALGASWLVFAVLLMVLMYFNLLEQIPWQLWVYAMWSLVMSACSYISYGIDKWKARRNARRIPERVLHLFEALGGWAGAALAQRAFRHKTQKRSFLLIYWAIVLLHLTIGATVLYYMSR